MGGFQLQAQPTLSILYSSIKDVEQNWSNSERILYKKYIDHYKDEVPW